MDKQLQKWLTETAYYSTAASITATGVVTYNAPVAFLCRTELQEVMHGPMFMPRAGEDVEWMHLLFTLTDVPRDARVWLPGDSTSDATKNKMIRRKETVRDEEGAVGHYEIYV